MINFGASRKKPRQTKSTIPVNADPMQSFLVMRAKQIAALLAVALAPALLSGCNTSESSNEAPAWDPCLAFPESVMQELGFDGRPTPQSDRRPCSWMKSGTLVWMQVRYLTKGSLAGDLRTGVGDDWRSDAISPASLNVGVYKGHLYRSKGVDPNFVCSARLETMNSNVVFAVYGGGGDPCPIAAQVATELAGYLPPAG